MKLSMMPWKVQLQPESGWQLCLERESYNMQVVAVLSVIIQF